MAVEELHQWAADNDRLVIAGLANNDGFLEYDQETLDAVKSRCIERYGDRAGLLYYQQLIMTLPDRRPELFPELAGFQK